MKEAKKRSAKKIFNSRRISLNNPDRNNRQQLIVYLSLQKNSQEFRKGNLSRGNCKTSNFISVKEWESFYINMYSTLRELNISLELGI